MLIFANYLKTTQPISIIHQMMRIWYLSNIKKREWKFFRRFNKGREKRNISDFAFFCVWTNETSASSPFAQLFSLTKTLQRSGT